MNFLIGSSNCESLCFCWDSAGSTAFLIQLSELSLQNIEYWQGQDKDRSQVGALNLNTHTSSFMPFYNR